MKASLLFGTITLLTASLPALGTSELEELRRRCAAQETQIRQLEAQLREHRKPSETIASINSAKQSSESPAAAYVVKSGDSLERIANRLKCPTETLARINGLKLNSVIHPGQKLIVPGATPAPAVSAPPPVAAASGSYKIREGDTYSSISRRTGIPVQLLISTNPSVKATALRPGQEIRLPQNGPATPSSAANTPKPAAPAADSVASAAEPPPSPPSAERKIRPVMIEGEMTYGDFAANHGTDIGRLNDLNGLDLTSATVLARGSELYVPAQP